MKISKTIVGSLSIKKLVKRLIYEHDQMGLKWREIGLEFPGVHFTTLHRIAHSNGIWTPRNEHIRELLGLTPKQRAKRPLPTLGSSGWERRFFKKIGKGNQGSLLESVSTLFERLRKGK